MDGKSETYIKLLNRYFHGERIFGKAVAKRMFKN
jgi:hypothetical protein